MMRGEILQGEHPEREDLYQKLVEWRHAALGAIEIGVEGEYLANQLELVKSILQASPEPWVRDLIDLMLCELRNNVRGLSKKKQHKPIDEVRGYVFGYLDGVQGAPDSSRTLPEGELRFVSLTSSWVKGQASGYRDGFLAVQAQQPEESAQDESGEDQPGKEEPQHQLICVFPDSDDDVPFAYTFGRVMKSHPELLVTGLDPQTGGVLLNVLSEYEYEHPIDPDDLPIELPTNVVIAGFPCRIDLANPIASEMTQAMALWKAMKRDAGISDQGNEWVPSVQLIWPDEEGRFPDEPGFVGVQPIFGQHGEGDVPVTVAPVAPKRAAVSWAPATLDEWGAYLNRTAKIFAARFGASEQQRGEASFAVKVVPEDEVVTARYAIQGFDPEPFGATLLVSDVPYTIDLDPEARGVVNLEWRNDAIYLKVMTWEFAESRGVPDLPPRQAG